MHLYTNYFFLKLWAKTILLVVQFYIHSASIFCKGVMVIDAVGLGMLCLVCSYPPTASPILVMLTCKLEFNRLVLNHASVFKQNYN